MAISQEYKEFSSENPWGKGATVVTADNVMYSRVRQEAIMAMRQNRATPEQQALVYEADAAIQFALQTEASPAAPALAPGPTPPPPPGSVPAYRRITL